MSNHQKPYVLAGEPLHEFLRSFWQRQIDAAEQETIDYRHPPLPLARIKKVMKSDPEVKMIAADAPILFCKACEIFITEITARAFIIADSNKRRTLSRADIAKAVSRSDQFDFLIDILPRDEPFSAAGGAVAGKVHGKKPANAKETPSTSREDHEPSTLAADGPTSAGHQSSSSIDQLQTMLHPSSHAESRPIR
ncbi:histone-fold-containing protein [Trametopsis cervina]|nr:histone-fold-containing protein [Trametopsis cervina]